MFFYPRSLSDTAVFGLVCFVFIFTDLAQKSKQIMSGRVFSTPAYAGIKTLLLYNPSSIHPKL